MSSVTPQLLFVHVPKLSNYYKPIDDFMYINYLPMGVLALCDQINKKGIYSRIEHIGLERILNPNYSIAELVKKQKIPIVGISLHWHFQSFDVIDVVKKIKAASPETNIVLGGFTASRFPEEILQNFEAVDAIIVGDGEGGILPFSQAVLQGNTDYSDVPNCIWRKEGEIINNGITYTANEKDLNELEYANLELINHYEEYRDFFRFPMFWMNNDTIKKNMKYRVGPDKNFPLAIGRGCAYNCTFCGGNQEAHKKLFNRHTPIVRSVSRVVDTMEKALGYGYTGFIISFDPNPLDDSYHLALMAEIRKRGLKCSTYFDAWGLPTRAIIDAFRETFGMKKSYLAISAETGSERLRNKNKGIYYSNQELFDTLDYMKEVKVRVMIYLGFGIPGETLEDIAETAQFSKLIRKKYAKILQGIYCVPLQIEPASALFEDPANHSVISQITSFMDYYRFHGRTDNSPITHTGYTPKTYLTNPEDYVQMIQEQRCNNYCFIAPHFLDNIITKRIPRFICNKNQKGWKKKGFGEPAQERKTFS